MSASARPKLAVWKFASCDGCQLSLLNLEHELLALADAVEIAYFLEATRATADGPYDLSLVEGSVTTPEDAERIREVRAASRALVTIGACATAGGIQALRNYARSTASSTPCTRAPSTSRPWRPRPRSATTSRSTSSFRAARSTARSCSRWSAPTSPGGRRG